MSEIKELERKVRRLENIILNNLAGDEDEAEENGLFSSLVGGVKRATGKKVRSYTGSAYHKHDADLDIHTSTTFEAANKTDALAQFKSYLRERGEKLSDYKIEVELD
ncbi:MAG: hypothetical protein WCD76_10295 [Pyrinomonadaceae bacterium]